MSECKDSLIEFPCDFQIKVIGENQDDFIADILEIASRHFPALNQNQVMQKPSQKGSFISLTLTVYATDKASLDALYQDLTKHPHIKMVL